MTAIKINELTKKYKDVTAVAGISLEIREGELFSLIGVNGAGKTTTVKMLSSLLRPTSGDALIYGHSITGEPDKVKEIIDISMQETAVARKLTVKENVDFYASLNGRDKDERAAAEKYVFDVFGLGKVADKRAGKLSGGWQRKLSIALALVSRPKVLFLDEPTLGLDVIARRELWKTIRELKKEMTIILTTHYMEEAEALSDRIGIMKEGRLLFAGTKEELFETTGRQNVEDAFLYIVSGGESDA